MAPPPRCPVCGMTIPWQCLSASQEFQCPSCQEWVRATKSSQRNGSLISFGLAAGAAYLGAARGVELVVVTLILFVLFTFVLGFVISKVFGFPLEVAPPRTRMP